MIAITQASIYWNEQRASYFSQAKIIKDQQSKHIPGCWNYEIGKGKWTHGDPDALLSKFAGKGQRVAGEVGIPGCRERVNFGEVIGYFVEEETKLELPTTKGIIHYRGNCKTRFGGQSR